MKRPALQLDDKIAVVLRDLELAALRAKYRWVKELGNDPFPFFYIDPPELAGNQIKQGEEALIAWELNNARKIVMRAAELATVGIKPEVLTAERPPETGLTIQVVLTERGRRTLEGSGLAVSEVLRFVRKFIWVGYYAIGIAILAFVFADRIGRIGWWQTAAGLALLIAVVFFVRRIWR